MRMPDITVTRLLEVARDLIEEPNANPEYTRGQLELIYELTGVPVEDLLNILFPDD